MFTLPPSTAYNKKIPKQVFYERLQVSPAVKRLFVEQVKAITWRNKIAHTTTNLAPGKQVVEIEVFEIGLKAPLADETLLRLIDKAIQAHIIYLLELDGEYQAWAGVKQLHSRDSKKSTLLSYFHTDWLAWEALPLKLEGLNVDDVYENFVWQIAGGRVNLAALDESIDAFVVRKARQKRLIKAIAALEAKLCREKQFNRQVEINIELKKLKEQLDHEEDAI